LNNNKTTRPSPRRKRHHSATPVPEARSENEEACGNSRSHFAQKMLDMLPRLTILAASLTIAPEERYVFFSTLPSARGKWRPLVSLGKQRVIINSRS
jgi:hypothetical protein